MPTWLAQSSFSDTKTSDYTALNAEIVRADVSGGSWVLTAPGGLVPRKNTGFGVTLVGTGSANVLTLAAQVGAIQSQGGSLVASFDVPDDGTGRTFYFGYDGTNWELLWVIGGNAELLEDNNVADIGPITTPQITHTVTTPSTGLYLTNATFQLAWAKMGSPDCEFYGRSKLNGVTVVERKWEFQTIGGGWEGPYGLSKMVTTSAGDVWDVEFEAVTGELTVRAGSFVQLTGPLRSTG